jgi:hypothetical protein
MLARNPLPVMVGCVIMMVCAVVLAVNDDRLVDWGGPLSKMVASHSMVQIKYLAPQLYGHRWRQRVEFLPFTI